MVCFNFFQFFSVRCASVSTGYWSKGKNLKSGGDPGYYRSKDVEIQMKNVLKPLGSRFQRDHCPTKSPH